MTELLPRAPKLAEGTCIATSALIESAQRVFALETNSPIHWIDLCTLIESIILHEKIAFPIIHGTYAEPILKPLEAAHLLDTWWPEAEIFRFPPPSTKEGAWKSDQPDEASDASDAVALMGGWPDAYFDGLSEIRRRALDGIAHGFAETALHADGDEVKMLLWAAEARRTSGTRFESAAALCLKKGVQRIQEMAPASRAAFAIPHVTSQDTYNDYAQHLRTLANDAKATLVKSVIEEPYFDSISVETAARDTLHGLLKIDYEEKIVGQIAKYIRIIPASPFAGIVLTKCTALKEVIEIAIDLREKFKSFRALLAEHRRLQTELTTSQDFDTASDLDRIEKHFKEALQIGMNKITTDLEIESKSIFDGLNGVTRIALSFGFHNYKSIVDQISGQLLELLKNWTYMNYGDVYAIVSHYPKMNQLSAASRRLIRRDLDDAIGQTVTAAAAVIRNNYGLTAASAQ